MTLRETWDCHYGMNSHNYNKHFNFYIIIIIDIKSVTFMEHSHIRKLWHKILIFWNSKPVLWNKMCHNSGKSGLERNLWDKVIIM